jgi:hypothetical protein
MSDQQSPTEVCITIDTEFSVGGAFGDPERCRPLGEQNVYCSSKSEQHGLEFLLRTFAEYETRATFFVESLQTAYFGPGPMGRIVKRIQEAGQDVQLHIHPCWQHFSKVDWIGSLTHGAPNDSCEGRSLDEMEHLIEAGLKAFDLWGVPRPIAMRTGNLQVDRTVYSAMATCGLRLASNVGLGLWRPPDPALQVAAGLHRIGSVLEVPVLSYLQLKMGAWRSWHLLTVAGASIQEMSHLLWRARQAGISPVVVLTHPFEYIKGGAPGSADVRRNRITKQRLIGLCRFLAENGSDFQSVSFGSAGPQWLGRDATEGPTLTVPLWSAAARAISNRANDVVGWL